MARLWRRIPRTGDKRKMTDKDKIKFTIRYLKEGLESKRTPPLYEELMKELGFVSEKELGKVEGKLADLTSEYYELENLKNNEINKAKEIIKRLIKATYGEGWNYSLQVKVEAEKFLKECE